MKWTMILLYGLVLGLCLVALQFFQYKLILLRNAEQWYIGLIALFFMVSGIWAGRKLSRNKQPVIPDAATSPEIQARCEQEVADKFGITRRELEVLELVAQGLSNQEIADRLFVSLNTVKTHTSNVFSKLDARRRTEAIRKAKAAGLLP